MIYPNWEAAAAASKHQRAVSASHPHPTPRGVLPCVIVIGEGESPYWAYASAHGIRLPISYGSVYTNDVDRETQWRPW